MKKNTNESSKEINENNEPDDEERMQEFMQRRVQTRSI